MTLHWIGIALLICIVLPILSLLFWEFISLLTYQTFQRLHRFVPKLGLTSKLRSTVHGEARWMNEKEKRAFFHSDNKGLVFGKHRMSLQESYKNVYVEGVTGSGKSTRYILPNLYKLPEIGGSAIVIDLAGELRDKCSGYLHSRGYAIKTICPTDPHRSNSFNSFFHAKTPQRLKILAHTLIHSTLDKENAFWNTVGTEAMVIAFHFIRNVPDPKLKNLAGARQILDEMAVSLHDPKAQAFIECHLDESMKKQYRAFMAQDPKVLASAISTARAALDLFSDPDVAKITNTDNLELETIRDPSKPQVIFLNFPEHRVKYFGILANLLISTVFEVCIETPTDRPVNPLFVFMDEFANLGKIHNYSTYATVLRKRSVSQTVVVQSRSQLDSVYGRDEAKTIFSGGLNSKLFLSGCADLETLNFLETICGSNTAYNTLFNQQSEKAQVLKEPIIKKDEIRIMDSEQAILISGRERPVQIDLPPYFTDPHMSRLAQIPAYKPEQLGLFETPAEE